MRLFKKTALINTLIINQGDHGYRLRWLIHCLLLGLLWITSSVQAETVAGFIPGEFSVNQSGAANYAIPLGVPKGPGNMQPELSINYSSNAGTGPLGVGFSMGGMSAIHRCGKTIIQDEKKWGINLDQKDRYCLDGQRLIAISGNPGSGGTEYRTELESFSKIVSYGGGGSDPSYWRVWTKSGQTMEFGNTASSRLELINDTRAIAWAVNSIVDAAGNEVAFSYSENTTNGEHLLATISYGLNQIDFLYEARPEASSRFFHGEELHSTQRLRAIASYYDGNLINKYILSYLPETSGKRFFLESITQCDSGGNCLPGITFQWTINSDSWITTDSMITQAPKLSANFGGVVRSLLADVNGDGITDVVWAQHGSFGLRTYASLGDGTGTYDSYLWSDPMTSGSFNDTTEVAAADADGDGKIDLIWTQHGSFGLRAYTALGDGTGKFGDYMQSEPMISTSASFAGVVTAIVTDSNGDGISDIVWTQHGSFGLRAYTALGDGTGRFGDSIPNAPLASGSFNNTMAAAAADANGDGISDLIWTQHGSFGLRAYTALGDGEGRFGDSIPSAPMISTSASFGGVVVAIVTDSNGDGISDVVWAQHGSFGLRAYTALGDGTGRLGSYIPSAPKGVSNFGGIMQALLADANGDGVVDIVWAQHALDGQSGSFGLRTYTAFGDGFGYFETATQGVPTTSGSHSSTMGPSVGDANGDGIPDILWTQHGPFGLRVYPAMFVPDQPLAGHVVKIRDSLGHISTIDYWPITDPTIYEKGTGAVYPINDLQFATYVVGLVTTQDGLGGINSTSYEYGGLRAHLTGRGMLGFAWMRATDDDTGIYTTTDYRQDFPFIGQVAYTEQQKSDGTLLGKTTMEYPPLADTKRHGGKVYFPHVEKSVNEKNDLNGAWMVTTTTENQDYDDFGNPTLMTVTTEEEDSEDTVIQQTVSTYDNHTTDSSGTIVLWHLGRLTSATVTHTNALGSTTRHSTFDYNDDGLLKKEIIEPGSPNFKLQKDYLYDAYGNINKVTVSGAGILADRVSETTYGPEGRFAETLINAKEHKETRTYDRRLGVMTGLTGPNQLQTSWLYDGFGRKIREDRADGTWTTISRGMCGVTGCPEDAPLGTVLYTTTESAGGTPVTEYSDLLGRVTRKVTTGFDGTLVYQDTQYNHLGQVARTSQPYFKGETTHWVSSEYDLLGRVKKMSQEGPTGALIHTNFSYNGLTTTVTDAKEHEKTTRKNAQGKVVRVDEEEGAWVTYKYDALGNLKETNANGLITSIDYDLRGRKMSMDDPDMGEWFYEYDAVGNLVWQKDANDVPVTMVYDELDRMTKRIEPEGTTDWEYDTAINGVGKLAWVSMELPDETPVYFKELTYDNLGRPFKTRITAEDETLSTTTEYDGFSRVDRVIRPEGFELENVYNAQGYLEAIRTPETEIGDYDAVHLSDTWDEIQQSDPNDNQLIDELQAAQAQADQLYAQAAVYRGRARFYWESAELLREQALNKTYLEEDRIAAIEQAQQNATDLDELADALEAKAAEYQRIADAILSLLPEDWQAAWFLDAKARYDQFARDTLDKVEAAYQAHPATAAKVWVPIGVGANTVFIKATPGFHGEEVLTTEENRHLETIGYWEAGTAELLRNLAAEIRDRRAVWVPIGIGGRTTFVKLIPGSSAPGVPVPDFLQVDHETLTHFFAAQVADQQARQASWERARNDSARLASRLERTQTTYTEMNTLLDGDGQITFWQATGRDAAGRLTSSIVGNGLETQHTYNQATGQLTGIVTGFPYADPIRNIIYEYDALNNVKKRIDSIQNFTETFQYDELDRLKQSKLESDNQAIETIDYTYDVYGNIKSKSDVGVNNHLYTYGDASRSQHNAGPHALLSAGDAYNGYKYDDNGNTTEGGGRQYEWSSYNKPLRLKKNNQVLASFKYGPDRARYLKTGQGGITTRYHGKEYERIEDGNKVEHKHFVYADGQLVAIHIKTSNNGVAQDDETRYLHRDSLGSIDAISDGAETDLLENWVKYLSYKPFGARRSIDLNQAPYIPSLINRGFTGHEHVDEMDLIHMNGRVYDPVVGRFLSADPTMQFPHASQGYNRYSYVLNNPLKYTDPSGYGIFSKIGKFFKKLWKNPIVRTVVAIAAAVVVGPWVAGTLLGLPSASLGFAIAAGASGGFVGGFIASGGDLRAGLIGGLTGAAFGFVGHGLGLPTNPKLFSPGHIKKIFAHGIVGGTSSKLSGGKFMHGFLSAGVTQAAAPQLSLIPKGPGRVIAASIVGGTASKLGGGKFANGAITGAFSRMFNDEVLGRKWQVDERGNEYYRKSMVVHGVSYQAKFFRCEGGGCIGHNLDRSDPATAAYLEAVNMEGARAAGYLTAAIVFKTPLSGTGIAASVANYGLATTRALFGDLSGVIGTAYGRASVFALGGETATTARIGVVSSTVFENLVDNELNGP